MWMTGTWTLNLRKQIWRERCYYCYINNNDTLNYCISYKITIIRKTTVSTYFSLLDFSSSWEQLELCWKFAGVSKANSLRNIKVLSWLHRHTKDNKWVKEMSDTKQLKTTEGVKWVWSTSFWVILLTDWQTDKTNTDKDIRKVIRKGNGISHLGLPWGMWKIIWDWESYRTIWKDCNSRHTSFVFVHCIEVFPPSPLRVLTLFWKRQKWPEVSVQTFFWQCI